MKRLTIENFLDRCEKIHHNKYDYSLVNYVNNYTKVKIICKEHGIFYITPNNHLIKKHGCAKCVGLYRTKEEFITKAEKIHGDKYDYKEVNYNKSFNKIKIICKKHNKIFEQTPHDHLSGNGCPYCKKTTISEFIEKANKIHNFKYDYSLSKYENAKTKIQIICKKHNKIFQQTPANHLSGIGCPLCNESKGENKIALFLENKNIKYIRQKKFNNCKYKRRLPFDFFLVDYNTCIEYDGKQHFEIVEYWGGEKYFEEIQIKDKIKNEYCKNSNINLIRIRYDENILNKLNENFN